MKCTHAWHSHRKVIMRLVAKSPKGRLEEWRPKAGLTKIGVLELLIKVKSSQIFSNSWPPISTNNLTTIFDIQLRFMFAFCGHQSKHQHEISRESARE